MCLPFQDEQVYKMLSATVIPAIAFVKERSSNVITPKDCEVQESRVAALAAASHLWRGSYGQDEP